MPPSALIELSSEQNRSQFFSKDDNEKWIMKGSDSVPVPESLSVHDSLKQVIDAEISKKKKSSENEAANQSQLNHDFIDLICQMFIYDPTCRISPDNALLHPFITDDRNNISNATSSQQHGTRVPSEAKTKINTTTQERMQNRGLELSERRSNVSTRSSTRRVVSDAKAHGIAKSNS